MKPQELAYIILIIIAIAWIAAYLFTLINTPFDNIVKKCYLALKHLLTKRWN